MRARPSNEKRVRGKSVARMILVSDRALAVSVYWRVKPTSEEPPAGSVVLGDWSVQV